MSWGWRKILQVRHNIRPFIWSRIRNGLSTSAWFDLWCSLGNLSNIISNRYIYSAGFCLDAKVADLIHQDEWVWPGTWYVKYPLLANVQVPNISDAMDDRYIRNLNNKEVEFSVAEMWECIRHKNTEVSWFHVVWFPSHIPRHAIHLWLVIKRKLKTHDMLRNWDVSSGSTTSLLCPFCNAQPDSHDHLFFGCSFNFWVWKHMTQFTDTPNMPSSLDAIVDFLIPLANLKSLNQVVSLEDSKFGFEGLAFLVMMDVLLIGVIGLFYWELCNMRWYFPIGAIVRKDDFEVELGLKVLEEHPWYHQERDLMVKEMVCHYRIEEDFVIGEGVVVSSSSLDRSTKSCLGGITGSLIFLVGLEEEACVDAMEVEENVSNLNKNVKRYSRKDLLACNNSHLGETRSAFVCNDAMNISCDSRMNDLLDDNNLFIFDDETDTQETDKNQSPKVIVVVAHPVLVGTSLGDVTGLPPGLEACSSQSLLWHQHLSYLNFTTINNLVKNNLVQGLPKMKFEKDHLYSACEQRKIHRKHHKSKMAFASNKPLYLLQMDLCGPMCIPSINGKRYVLVVVDDYSRYTWVFFLHSKYEASENASTKWCRGKEESNLSRSCKNYAYFCKLPLFLWAESIATACFMNKRKPNIKFFCVLGCRCYLLNDYEDVGKLKAKGILECLLDIQKNLLLLEFTTNELIMKSSTTNVETSINEKVFLEISESFQGESSSSSLNGDVQ
uniref:Reverse transcriptase zinc-binding domain-containing protein n=1 Tax=Tanacetum cinerariifolium TaxID=118510 RepID=A0A6L2JD18_TANCI|nr:hypothetical protein [Tanacetum cinerariifolium]